MSQSHAKQTHVVETIADAELWEAIVDAVNTISVSQEAAFEFDTDGLTIRVIDAASVAMIHQDVDADGFDHFDVANDDTVVGINTKKLADIIDAADGDDPVELALNATTRKFAFQSSGVEYDLAGIDAETISGSPTDTPGLKDKHDYTIRADMPVDKWATGIDVVDLAGSGQGTFVYDVDDPPDDHDGDGEGKGKGALSLEGQSDTDASRVALSTADRFRWRDDPPDDRVTCVMSNDYMENIIDVLEDGDDDVVRFVTGSDLPYHVWQTHADGRVETKIVQAPRIDTNA